jgi:fatty acid desaturase
VDSGDVHAVDSTARDCWISAGFRRGIPLAQAGVMHHLAQATTHGLEPAPGAAAAPPTAPSSPRRVPTQPTAPRGATNARRLAIAAQLIRIVAPATILFACSLAPTVALTAAAAMYVGMFTLTHELAHGALGLPRRRNDLALAVAGVCMATSGHGLRLMHLRHHADPLGDGDLEGRAARMPAYRALLTAPALSLQLVVAAWRTATARDRRWQRAEYAALAALAGLAVASGCHALQCYLVVGVAAQLLAPFWAGHLPHRTPAWLLALARWLSRAGSMTMRTLVVHDAHHRRPKLPTYALSDRA